MLVNPLFGLAFLRPRVGDACPHIWIEYRSTGIPESQSCDIGFPPIPHFPYHSPIGVVRQPHVRLLQRLTHDYTTPGFDSIDGITTSMTPAQVGGFIGHRLLSRLLSIGKPTVLLTVSLQARYEI